MCVCFFPCHKHACGVNCIIHLYRLCCIAPILAAKVIPGCEVTVGSDLEDGGRWPYAGTAGAIGSMNSTHVNKDVTVSLAEA